MFNGFDAILTYSKSAKLCPAIWVMQGFGSSKGAHGNPNGTRDIVSNATEMNTIAIPNNNTV
eukprot:5638921-Amphidinium_carterae.1